VEGRGFWSTAWTIRSKKDVEESVAKARRYNFNMILPEVRFRGDAFYFPNRYSSTYANQEPRSHLLEDPELDVLEYMVKLAHDEGIEVHAWVTVYVSTFTGCFPSEPNHLYNAHPEWITENRYGRTMNWNEMEGAYLDPGIPEVTKHLFNVFMDIVWNYDVDGIHLDYIRYPGREWGYDPEAVKRFTEEYGVEPASHPDTWDHWRRRQVNNLVRALYTEIMRVKPWVSLSAAVFPRATAWYNKLQDWKTWCSGSYIDILVPMAYSTDTEQVLYELKEARRICPQRFLFGGLRAWDTAIPSKNPHRYKGHRISEKIVLARRLPLEGFALFSFQGLRDNVGAVNEDEYFRALSDTGASFASPAEMPEQQWKSQPENGMVAGLVRDSLTGECIDRARIELSGVGRCDTTCGNGFFLFTDVPSGEYRVNAEKRGYSSVTIPEITLTVEPFRFLEPVVLTMDPAAWETLVLDHDTARRKGSWTMGSIASDKHGPDYIWTSTYPKGRSLAWWEVTVPASGYYEVALWWCGGPNRSTRTIIGVGIGDDVHIIMVNQQENGGRWNELGTWFMEKGERLLVGVSNKSFADRVAVADALRIQKKDGVTEEDDAGHAGPSPAESPTDSIPPSAALHRCIYFPLIPPT
jgi:uncharacterized lipoprotein YddW (UPF0748 family)